MGHFLGFSPCGKAWNRHPAATFTNAKKGAAQKGVIGDTWVGEFLFFSFFSIAFPAGISVH